MQHISLAEDMEALRLSHGALASFKSVQFVVQSGFYDPQTLVAFGKEAHLGFYELLGLVLKADWEAHWADSGRQTNNQVAGDKNLAVDAVSDGWQPWQYPEKFTALLATFADCPTADRLALVLLEQWALGCHHLSQSEVFDLKAYHARCEALLRGAPASQQAAFLADKHEWLSEEHTLTVLDTMQNQRRQEMEAARIRFMDALGKEYQAMVEAGNNLALWCYRRYFDDVAMEDTKIQAQMAFDLDVPGHTRRVVFDSALEAVLRVSAEDLKADLDYVAELKALYASGMIEQASEEEKRYAMRRWHQLRSKIFPDNLAKNPKLSSMHQRSKERLKEIWNEAMGTYNDHERLSRARLLNFAKNLDAWHREVDQILCNVEFHDPSKLMGGTTFETQWDYVRKSIVEVQDLLHAARNDLIRLEADPTHAEYMRVLALDPAALEQERERMVKQSQAWDAEAALIEAQMRGDPLQQVKVATKLAKDV